MFRVAVSPARRRVGFRAYQTSYPSLLHSRFTIPQIGNDESRNRPSPIIPRIVLNERYFSESGNDNSEKKITMKDRRDNARAAARKGAHSAGVLMKKYGPIFVGTYLVVYTATLGGLFVSVESGILDPAYVMSFVTDGTDDAKSSVQVIVEILDRYSWTKQFAPLVERNPSVANFGVAWVATKFTEPLRIAITVPLLPRVSRFLGRSVPVEDVEEEEKKEEEKTEEEKKEEKAPLLEKANKH
eukprot:scaffold1525_cov142-Cylindrotheca_fusiformis.AAC.193